MRGKLALLFGYLTALLLIAALATPWFKWENENGLYNGGDRALCWIDATCRTNSDTNTLIFKGGYRAQRFYDATLMLLVIPAVLMFLPLLWAIHKLNTRSDTNSRLNGAFARVLIVLLGLITLLCWLAAIIVFSQGIENRYRTCDFQSNIPQWGCAGPNQGEPAENNQLNELYGHRDIPILVQTFNGNSTTNSTSTQHVEWAVLSGWYFAMLASLFLVPTILFGLLMKNKKPKVVTQTTTTTAVKEQYYPPQQIGRAPVVAPAAVVAPATVVAPSTTQIGNTGYVARDIPYTATGPATTGYGASTRV